MEGVSKSGAWPVCLFFGIEQVSFYAWGGVAFGVLRHLDQLNRFLSYPSFVCMYIRTYSHSLHTVFHGMDLRIGGHWLMVMVRELQSIFIESFFCIYSSR